jgi:hypothetical protein
MRHRIALTVGVINQGYAKIALCVASVADREELRGRRPVAGVQASRVCGPCDPVSDQGNINFTLCDNLRRLVTVCW